MPETKKTRKCCVKKNTATKKQIPNKHIGLGKNEMWLKPSEDTIRGRYEHALWMINQRTKNGKGSLSDYASGYLYFGLHKTSRGGWVIREWAPNATGIYLIGTFNNWQESEKYAFKRVSESGNWELKLPKE